MLKFGAPRQIRTDTVRFLRALTLPIGLEKQKFGTADKIRTCKRECF